MRILLTSDLHTEFWKGNNKPVLPPLPDDFDVVVAAGDIGVGFGGLEWLANTFEASGKPILYTLGNHEYYGRDYDQLNNKLNHDAPAYGVTLLNPGTITIAGYTFIAANLWSDMELRGYQKLEQWDMRGFADFEVIKIGEKKMTVTQMRYIHSEEYDFICGELEKQKDNSKTVVITHFIPSQLCIAHKWVGNPLNPYFTNDLDDLFDRYKYPLHLYGHTHDRGDIVHPYGTRLVANPLGYPKENPGAYEWKVIEV